MMNTGINEKMNPASAYEILEKHISGYHEYALEAPVHILYAGESLCSILGMTPEELTSPLTDMLFPAVHPADGKTYQIFLQQMSETEQTASCEYRLMTGRGEFRRFAVSMTSVRRADGRMTGYGVMAEIERDPGRMENLQFMNDTVPCGLLRYSCEKIPRITFVNDTMLDLMRIPKESDDLIDPLELYKSNIYMQIAEESRGRFSTVLREVFLQGKPHAGEISVLRGDGSKGRLFGWVTKRTGADGREEFQSICMDVTDRYRAKQAEQKSGRRNVPHVRIRTFGYFDVFVDGRPIMFRHEKAKELLALLVDRQGGFVSSEEAIGFLWEDEPASPVVLARYRKVSMRLKNLLEEYGIAQIVESVNGRRRIVPEAVDCDLYAYLSQDAESADLFNGSYLTNYSWGETTLGDLLNRQETSRRR